MYVLVQHYEKGIVNSFDFKLEKSESESESETALLLNGWIDNNKKNAWMWQNQSAMYVGRTV